MLVAAIDRNKASEQDKYVAKVVSSPSSVAIAQSEESINFLRHLSRRKGIILRNGDKRNADRRNRVPDQAAPKAFKDRRHNNNRTPHPQWNPQTHEIIVIAVERDAAAMRKWNVGEEIVLGPPSPKEQINVKSPAARPKNQGSSEASYSQSQEKDYIVSLSRSLDKNI